MCWEASYRVILKINEYFVLGSFLHYPREPRACWCPPATFTMLSGGEKKRKAGDDESKPAVAVGDLLSFVRTMARTPTQRFDAFAAHKQTIVKLNKTEFVGPGPKERKCVGCVVAFSVLRCVGLFRGSRRRTEVGWCTRLNVCVCVCVCVCICVCARAALLTSVHPHLHSSSSAP